MKQFKKIVENISDDIISFIYPPICISCEKLQPIGTESAKRSICDNCFSNFLGGSFCDESKAHACNYDGVVQECVYKLKYGKREYAARGLGFVMANSIDRDFFVGADFIVPVPIHKNRYKSRGFNQAELLSIYLCRNLNIDNLKRPTNILKRVKDTRPMAELDPSLRKISISNAFDLNRKIDIINKTIIIVDDIYTTGSTLDECKSVLYNHGAAKVKYATLSVVS